MVGEEPFKSKVECKCAEVVWWSIGRDNMEQE